MSLDTPGTTPPRRRSLLRRVSLGILKWGAVLLVVVLLVTAVAARILHARDSARWKAPGRMVGVGDGRRMHLYCTGSGTPTAILEAGLGDFSVTSWNSVQPAISGFTRACSYDRASAGWSDPSPHAPLPDAIVADLHTLLQNAGEPPPYVLVGHSLGGPIARHYAVRHPAQVAGLVLVDGSHEDQLVKLPLPGWFKWLVAALPALNLLGIDRVAFALAEGDTITAISGARGTMPTMARNTAAIQSQLSPFFDQIRRDARPFGALPLVVLTAGRMSPIPGFSPDEMRSFRDAWRALHQDIAARSTNSHWIIAEKSAHYIQRDEPELVTAAVKEVVDGVRDASEPLPPEAPAVRPVAPARPTAH